jgi:hypothetical protein
MSRRHAPADCDLLHDSADDVTDTHAVTAAQAELAAILGWGPRRFTNHQWATLLAVEEWAARPLSAPSAA